MLDFLFRFEIMYYILIWTQWMQLPEFILLFSGCNGNQLASVSCQSPCPYHSTLLQSQASSCPLHHTACLLTCCLVWKVCKYWRKEITLLFFLSTSCSTTPTFFSITENMKLRLEVFIPKARFRRQGCSIEAARALGNGDPCSTGQNLINSTFPVLCLTCHPIRAIHSNWAE